LPSGSGQASKNADAVDVHASASCAYLREDDEVVGIGDDMAAERLATSGLAPMLENRFI
jgi:hypothetical protein